MPIDYARMMSLPPRIDSQDYGPRDAMLYALGVGAGMAAAGGDETELRHVYEEKLMVLPTMAVVLATPGFWLKNPVHGADWQRILHGEQMLTLHHPLPQAARVRSTLTIDEIFDKGAGKGAILYSTRTLHDEDSGALLATLRQSSFLRGDGGCGGHSGSAPRRPAIPDRGCDLAIDLPTRPEQALIYRLLGDYNPLHADPAVGRAAGFTGPILHGLCTYGIAGRALMQAARATGRRMLSQFDLRFSSPVYPGETIRTEIWWNDNTALFRARVTERDTIVLDGGYAAFS